MARPTLLPPPGEAASPKSLQNIAFATQPVKLDDMPLEDHTRSGRPSTSRTDENIQKIRDAMFDRRRTIGELEALTEVSWSPCQRILIELHMK